VPAVRTTKLGSLFDRLSGQVGRGGVRLSLMMRAVALIQAVFTLAMGFDVYRRLWLGVTVLVVAIGWSAVLTSSAWGRRCPPWMYASDCVVALVVLGALAAAVPAASLAATVAMMLGFGFSPGRAGVGLAVLVIGYGVPVWWGQGFAVLPLAAGTAIGMVVYCGCGVVIARYLRGLADTVSAVTVTAAEHVAALGRRRVRVEEFSRLHDEAVQGAGTCGGRRCRSAHRSGLRGPLCRPAAQACQGRGPR
jgi:hypothetical protein